MVELSLVASIRALAAPIRWGQNGPVPYVITEPCIDVVDRACVDMCPVDCIYEGPDQLYIHPMECIDCGVCAPVCPVFAIFSEGDVPGGIASDAGAKLIGEAIAKLRRVCMRRWRNGGGGACQRRHHALSPIGGCGVLAPSGVATPTATNARRMDGTARRFRVRPSGPPAAPGVP